MAKMMTLKNGLNLLIGVALLALALFTPHPVYAAAPQPATAAEAYLLDNLRQYGYADLAEFSANEADQVVDGFFLGDVLKDPQVQSQPGVFITNLTVAGDVVAVDAIIPINLTFTNTLFAGTLYFNNAQLQSLVITDSTIEGDMSFYDAAFQRGINFQRNTVQGSIFLAYATVQRDIYIVESGIGGSIDLTHSVVELGVVVSNNNLGELSFLRASANKNVDLRFNTFNGGLNFYGARIVGELLLDGSSVLGAEPVAGASYPIDFQNAIVGGLASFADMTFTNQANFYNFYCGNTMDFANTVFESDAIFENASAVRAARFENTTFNGIANFDFFTANRFLDFVGVTFMKDFSLFYATVAWPYFSDVEFNGPVNFKGLHISEDLEVTDSQYTYGEMPFTITLATVTGTTKFDNFTTPAGLVLTQSQLGSLRIAAPESAEIASIDLTSTVIKNDLQIENINMDSFVAAFARVGGTATFKNNLIPNGLTLTESQLGSLTISSTENLTIDTLDLTSTNITGDLSIENATLQSFLAESAAIGGSTSLQQVAIRKRLDLRNSSIGFLKVDQNFEWPNDAKAFNLRGMTYTDIDLGDQGLTEDTWQGLLLLIEQSAYSPQAYEALAQFLTDKGHPDWASKVKLANKIRERDNILTPLSGQWFWSWFLFLFAGYGYMPFLAFIWSGLVVVYGTFVFRRKEDMIPIDQETVPLPYSAWLYSFSLFLPYIDIDITGKWEPNPERKWAHRYKYIHMLLGWVLAPIALLSFSGLFG